MQSKDFELEILNLNHATLQVEYYSINKDHLEVWEPERLPDKFYTLKFQQNKMKELLDLMKEGQSMHFIMLNKSKTQMIGACNYTKIKDNKCWLGYSISKKI
jgi:ribosomal-protein-alanine N-acetyltransferase